MNCWLVFFSVHKHTSRQVVHMPKPLPTACSFHQKRIDLQQLTNLPRTSDDATLDYIDPRVDVSEVSLFPSAISGFAMAQKIPAYCTM
jgi:hypothetical protein